MLLFVCSQVLDHLHLTLRSGDSPSEEVPQSEVPDQRTEAPLYHLLHPLCHLRNLLHQHCAALSATVVVIIIIIISLQHIFCQSPQIILLLIILNRPTDGHTVAALLEHPSSSGHRTDVPAPSSGKETGGHESHLCTARHCQSFPVDSRCEQCSRGDHYFINSSSTIYQ